MKQHIDKVTKIVKSPEFIKFVVVGGTAFLVDFLTLNFFTVLLNFKTYLFGVLFLPNLISTGIAIIYNYFLQKNWAFKSQQKSYSEAVRFLAVQVFNLVIFNGIIFGIITQAGISVQITKIFVTGMQMIVSYVLYKFFVFKKPQDILKEEISSAV